MRAVQVVPPVLVMLALLTSVLPAFAGDPQVPPSSKKEAGKEFVLEEAPLAAPTPSSAKAPGFRPAREGAYPCCSKCYDWETVCTKKNEKGECVAWRMKCKDWVRYCPCPR